MPIATPDVYAEMIDRAKAGAFAYPAINVTSSQTLNAALQGFAEAGSDGILQISTGGAEYLSGPHDQEHGARCRGAGGVRPPRREGVPDQRRAAHRPLPQGQARRLPAAAGRDLAGARRGRARAAVPVAHVGRLRGRARGEPPDRRRAARVDARRRRSCWRSRSASSVARRTASTTRSTTSCTRPRATRCVRSRCSAPASKGRYLLAATFGNVHGVYKPGNVKLRPSILKDIQDEVGSKVGKDKPFDLVFHGGSGSTLEEIREALDYGVVKMNVDTDTQYAFTRPIVDHMFAQLLRRAEDRRRGRQQEAVRPARLRQGRRGRHGRPRRRVLRGPPLRRHLARQVARPPSVGGAGHVHRRSARRRYTR